MSAEPLVEFLQRAEQDRELQAELSAVSDAEGVARIASAHGLPCDPRELERVVQLQGFLGRVAVEPALREELQAAKDPQAVVAIGQAHGFLFCADELALLSVDPSGGELDDDTMDEVVGGARQPAGDSFGSLLESGLGKDADAALEGGSTTAPYIPGGSVLAAAISGIRS